MACKNQQRGHTSAMANATSVIKDPTHPDRLTSFEDRQALSRLVGSVLAPPDDLPRLYGRLRQESIDAMLR